MKISFLKLLLCLMILLPLMLCADDQRGFIRVKDKAGQEVCLYENSYALLIGVSEYTNGFPKLPGVKKDIPVVKTVLEKHGFIVTVVENPTLEQMEKAYKDFINKFGQKPNDRLLLYFSGHGHTMKLADGREMGYIVPADAPNPNIDKEGFHISAMDMEQIEVYARRIQSKHAMFMFDSCFSGSIFNVTRAIPENISYKTANPVRQIITAGSADEEVPDKSIFCQQFTEAIDGEGDTDKDGYITGVELGEFLQKNVINYSREGQHPQYGKIRDAKLDKGDFVFQMTKKPIPEPSSGGFSISDLKTEAEKQTNMERVKTAWANNLSDMKKAFSEIKDFETGSGAEALKANAWQRFINSFRDDNPYSQEDDTMRAEANRRLDYWKNQPAVVKPEIKPEIDTSLKTIRGKDGAEMVLIPAGEFQMGSNDNDSEKPIHTVHLDAFYIDKYEVTNAQYRKFTQATGHKEPEGYGYINGTWQRGFKPWQDKNYNGDNQPVVCVTWDDAKAYAEWAGKRLPTEAEWEKAARGGLAGKKYVWGDEWPPPTGSGNFADISAKKVFTGWSIIDGYDDGNAYPAPVGKFTPNGYGLYDMAGNVWEWCSDWYDPDYYANSPRQNPEGPSSGSWRVCRGGSWYFSIALNLRVAYRSAYDEPYDNIGVRCVVRVSE